MPFVPNYALQATFRDTPAGGYLLVVTVLDEEDGRSTTLMEPSPEWSWQAFRDALAAALARYETDHAL